MPYDIIKKPNGRVKVVNKETGRVLSSNTTRTKANAQIRAIHANKGK